ncbi:MAG: hypothetical protein QGG36_07025 [Pirellulaceae bacterium]|nr:hypothetical protein [Pirellulaceae bacterium]MDP7015534.1 hypothetical protein [Pirellulaceae bacterium]
MSKVESVAARPAVSTRRHPWSLLFWPIFGPLFWLSRSIDRHFLSYLTGRVVRDRSRIFTIRFVWYGDSVYLHPMIWGSLLLYAVAMTGFAPGWLLLVWFAALFVCYLTIMYNFNVVKSSVLLIGIVAAFGLAYFSTVELSWNPLRAFADHVRWLDADVSPGFYIAAAYLFTALIICEVGWAWLFHRVEIDESYVYEHRFLQGTSREPIFARGLKRETKDLLELALLGAADIQHRTKSGYKRFKNVPFASLWLGNALDSLLDYRRRGEIELQEAGDEAAEQARMQDAVQDLDEMEDDGVDGMDDGVDEEGDDGDE